MTKALEEEVKQLEEQEAAQESAVKSPEEIEESADEVQPEAEVKTPVEESGEPEESKGAEEASEADAGQQEEDESLKQQKIDAYRERVEKRKAQQQAPQPEVQVNYEKSDDEISDDDVKAFIKQQKQQQKEREQAIYIEKMVEKAKGEVASYEKEYAEVFPAYTSDVENALEFTKLRLVKDGMSEADADKYLEREKVMIADRAVAEGRDPIEAIHIEAKKINEILEAYADKMGYQKAAKTNLQAIREASKPNAATGGGGKGALASKKEYSDFEGDEVDNLSVGQMLQMSKQGEL